MVTHLHYILLEIETVQFSYQPLKPYFTYLIWSIHHFLYFCVFYFRHHCYNKVRKICCQLILWKTLAIEFIYFRYSLVCHGPSLVSPMTSSTSTARDVPNLLVDDLSLIGNTNTSSSSSQPNNEDGGWLNHSMDRLKVTWLKTVVLFQSFFSFRTHLWEGHRNMRPYLHCTYHHG